MNVISWVWTLKGKKAKDFFTVPSQTFSGKRKRERYLDTYMTTWDKILKWGRIVMEMMSQVGKAHSSL